VKLHWFCVADSFILERIDGRVLIGVIGVLLIAAAAYEYSLVQGLAPAS
jgi:hypothetical protein